MPLIEVATGQFIDAGSVETVRHVGSVARVGFKSGNSYDLEINEQIQPARAVRLLVDEINRALAGVDQ